MTTEKKISIIGCGNIGLSIMQGLIDDKTIPSKNITATRRNIEELSLLNDFDVKLTTNNIEAVNNSDIVLIAVKPYDIFTVLEEIKGHIDPKRHIVISIATGITISQIKEVLKTSLPIFRAMPNIAANVRESLTCICNTGAGSKEIAAVKSLFDSIGTTIAIEEDLMESATILGSCGIAYALRFIRAMIQGGIQIGFDVKVASAIVNQTVKGAAELLIELKQHPEYEIDKVTTPKGCTIVGINEMEHNGFSSSLIKGIVASYKEIEK
jgi:pyrroline-5-carboxylate reductase